MDSESADERRRGRSCQCRAVQEVPLAQRALVAVDDRRAFAVQDQEVVVDRLAVVAAVRLGGLQDLDVDAGVRPSRVVGLEVGGDRPAGCPWAGASATSTMNGASTPGVLA
jgi:hypothetical protein